MTAAERYVDFAGVLDRRLWREVTSEYLHAPEAAHELNLLKLLGPHAQLVDLIGREREAGALRADVDVATLANVVYALIDHAILRFVVIDEITSRQTLEALRTQLELCLRPQIVSR